MEIRHSAIDHDDIKKRMEESEQAYYQTCSQIDIRFQLEGEECRSFIDVPEKERLWKALLLSFGNRVRVAGPGSCQEELTLTAGIIYLITIYSCRAYLL